MAKLQKNKNVDQEELAKFEALAYRWWDIESEFKPLHDINPLRLNYIDKHAGLEGKKVLDIGCGGGILSESMAQRGAQVKGIDLGEAPLAVAKIHAKEQNTDFVHQCEIIMHSKHDLNDKNISKTFLNDIIEKARVTCLLSSD